MQWTIEKIFCLKILWNKLFLDCSVKVQKKIQFQHISQQESDFFFFFFFFWSRTLRFMSLVKIVGQRVPQHLVLQQQFELQKCCGADKRVDSANDLRVMRVSIGVSQRQWRETKGEITDTTKGTFLFAGITNVYVNVRGGCMWSSARMGYVVSWYGRVVVVCSRTFDEGSWCRSSRGDTARCLMLVSWDRSVVGKSMSRFWHFVGMVESWLLARNSESLRGLVVAMLGQSVTASRYVDWMLCYRSVVVGSYGFAVPDSCTGVSFTVAMALSRQIAVRAYRLQ